MDYAITTLDIEISRLQYALRVSETSTIVDRGGHAANYLQIEPNLTALRKAKAVLEQWAKDNPEENDNLNHKLKLL